MDPTCREVAKLAGGRAVLDYNSSYRIGRPKPPREEMARILRGTLQSFGVGLNCDWFAPGQFSYEQWKTPPMWICMECDRRCTSNDGVCAHCGTKRGHVRCNQCGTEGRLCDADCSFCRTTRLRVLSPQERFDAYPEPIRYVPAIESAPTETKENPTEEESADPDLEACVEVKPKQSPQWYRWIAAIPWAMVVCAFVYFAIVWLTRRECEWKA